LFLNMLEELTENGETEHSRPRVIGKFRTSSSEFKRLRMKKVKLRVGKKVSLDGKRGGGEWVSDFITITVGAFFCESRVPRKLQKGKGGRDIGGQRIESGIWGGENERVCTSDLDRACSLRTQLLTGGGLGGETVTRGEKAISIYRQRKVGKVNILHV